jgi:hypothetical protein
MFLHKIQSSCSIEEFAFEEEIYHCHCYIFNLRHIVKETSRSLKDKFIIKETSRSLTDKFIIKISVSNRFTFRITVLFIPTDIFYAVLFILFLSQNNNFTF